MPTAAPIRLTEVATPTAVARISVGNSSLGYVQSSTLGPPHRKAYAHSAVRAIAAGAVGHTPSRASGTVIRAKDQMMTGRRPRVSIRRSAG